MHTIIQSKCLLYEDAAKHTAKSLSLWRSSISVVIIGRRTMRSEFTANLTHLQKHVHSVCGRCNKAEELDLQYKQINTHHYHSAESTDKNSHIALSRTNTHVKL